LGGGIRGGGGGVNGKNQRKMGRKNNRPWTQGRKTTHRRRYLLTWYVGVGTEQLTRMKKRQSGKNFKCIERRRRLHEKKKSLPNCPTGKSNIRPRMRGISGKKSRAVKEKFGELWGGMRSEDPRTQVSKGGGHRQTR